MDASTKTDPRIVSLVRKINATVHDERLWLELGLVLFENGDTEGLRSLFNFRRTFFGTAMPFVLSVVDAAIESRDAALCRDVLTLYPDDCPYAAATIGRLGCVQARLFEIDAAVANIREGLRRLGDVQRLLPDEIESLAAAKTTTGDSGCLHEWAKLAALLEPASQHPQNRLPMPKLTLWNDEPPPSELACIAFADPFWLCRRDFSFVAAATACLGDAGILVLLVVNPDKETFSHMDVLSRDFPRLRFFIASHQGDKLFETAASSRFILAGQLLERLSCPLVFLDIEAKLSPDGKDGLKMLSNCPLSYRRTGFADPLRLISTDVLAACPGPIARRFFEDTAQFLLGKLAEDMPLGQVDQAALLRSVCLAHARGDAVIDAASVLKDRASPLESFVDPQTTPSGKLFGFLAESNFAPCFSIGPDGRPAWPKRTKAP